MTKSKKPVSKKETKKKPEPKKLTPTKGVSKVPPNIIYAQRGRNLIIELNGEKKTKTAPSEDLAVIRAKIDSYNEKKSTSKYNEIVKIFTPIATAKKEKETKEATKKAAVKSVQRKIKKGTKETGVKRASKAIIDDIRGIKTALENIDKIGKEDLEQIQKLLDKHKAQEKSLTPEPQRGVSRRGEH